MSTMIPLKMPDTNYVAAIRNPLPPGPYIKAHQHQTDYRQGMKWSDALTRAEALGDLTNEIHLTWGSEIWARIDDEITIVAYYYDTSD